MNVNAWDLTGPMQALIRSRAQADLDHARPGRAARVARAGRQRSLGLSHAGSGRGRTRRAGSNPDLPDYTAAGPFVEHTITPRVGGTWFSPRSRPARRAGGEGRRARARGNRRGRAGAGALTKPSAGASPSDDAEGPPGRLRRAPPGGSPPRAGRLRAAGYLEGRLPRLAVHGRGPPLGGMVVAELRSRRADRVGLTLELEDLP
jgi:hypothetical protein